MRDVDAVQAERLKALSLEAKIRLLTGADFWSLWPEPAIGLRRLVVSDGPAGVRGKRWDERDPSANVPSPTALSATWDEARMERVGRLLAAEHRLIPPTRPVDGRLVYEESVHVGHRAYERAGVEPAFWFGHGLGYTDWEYLDARVVAGGAGGATVQARVRNRGRRAGREVVQVYASRPDSAVERPSRWLAGFATVDAGPGEEATVEVAVPARAFAHWDGGSHAWRTEPGVFRLAVGRSASDLPLRLTFTTG
jgi:fibronectin type III domain protein